MGQPEPPSGSLPRISDVVAPAPGPQPTPSHAATFEMPLRHKRFLLTLLLLLIVVGVYIALPFLTAVVFALVFGYLLHPLYRRLLRGVRFRWIAASIMLVIVAVAMVAPLAYVGWAIFQESSALQGNFEDVDGYRQQAVDVLVDFGVSPVRAEDVVNGVIGALVDRLQGAATDALASAPLVVIGLVVFFILLFYIFIDGERAIAWLRMHLPLSNGRSEMLLDATGERVRAIMLGTFFVYALQGIVAGIGWWIFGFPAPFLWGFIMTILAILPFLGAQIVTLPAGVLAILRGDLFAGIGLIIYTLVVVGIIDDIVRPYVIGKRSGVHPALILLGTLGGIEVFGVSGLILGPLLLGLIEPVLRTWTLATKEAAAPTEPEA